MMEQHHLKFGMFCVLMATLGCGWGGDSGRSNVTGTVLFNGSPVDGGTVTFEPDASKGGAGPQCIAFIENGKYRTKDGLGPVPGPTIVKIEGFGPAPISGNGNLGFPLPLFPAYTTTIEVSKGASTANFDVPSAKKK